MTNFLLRYPSLHTDLAALLLRLIFGGLFIYHGYGKIIAYDQMATMMGDPIGIGSRLSLNLLIFAEFFCGILVTLGLLTRLAVIPIFIAMLVAYSIAHARDAFDVKELPFLFLTLSVVVFVLGSGRFSLDRLFQRNRAIRRNP
jgi:putative oxidoreductase